MLFYFYIISCIDENITDFYIGHAVDMTARGRLHKHSSVNDKGTLLYKTIRANGGWNNWKMEQIDEMECESERDALVRECELYDLLCPSLNKIRPIRLPYDHPSLVEKRREATRKSRANNKKIVVSSDELQIKELQIQIQNIQNNMGVKKRGRPFKI
jgi:hypothetical protein